MALEKRIGEINFMDHETKSTKKQENCDKNGGGSHGTTSTIGRCSTDSPTSFALSKSECSRRSHSSRRQSIIGAQHTDTCAGNLSGIRESETFHGRSQPDLVEMSLVVMFENEKGASATRRTFSATGSHDDSWDEIEPISPKIRALPRELDFNGSGSSFF